MNPTNRIGFRQHDEEDEIPTMPAMDTIVSDGRGVKITEAHQETRDRIDVARSFIASDAFAKLTPKQRVLKVREVEWLAKVDAQLNASYGGAYVEPKE